MGNTPQNTDDGKKSASPLDQTQKILNEIIERIRTYEFSEVLAGSDMKNDFTDEDRIIVNDIKAEFAKDEEATKHEYIEAVEERKEIQRLQRDCDYIRGLCQLTIKSQRANQEAIDTAKGVLAQLPKIERGDYSHWRELKDALFILMEALRADDKETKAKENKHTKAKRNRPTKAAMANRNKLVAMAARNFKREHGRLPTVDEIKDDTDYNRNQIYATDAYKEGEIAKNSAKVATEMVGGSVHRSQYYSGNSEQRGRADTKSKTDQAELDGLIEEQKEDDKIAYVR